MRKPDKNSKRQRLIALEVGGKIEFSRAAEKVGTISSLLYSIKQDERKGYSYETTEETIVVTRIS